MAARALASALFLLLCAPAYAQLLHIARVHPAPMSFAGLQNQEGGSTAPLHCVNSGGTPVTCNVQYFGGSVISNVKIYVVFWGSGVTPGGDLAGFYTTI